MTKHFLRDATVVITGASSGIGRATALSFARQGARVVLAARRANILAEVAAECEHLGAETLVVPTDVTDSQAVRHLAEAAAAFGGGGIDIWVNNAGAGAVGLFEQVPLPTHEQVLHINLFGSLYGAYAVLPYFKRQGHGTLINVISLGAWLPEPYTAAYTASKFGLRGLFDTLRAELSTEPRIHVCDVHPSYIDTPGFQHGANYTGRLIKPAPPVFPAQKVADTVLALARRPQPSVIVGWTGKVLRLTYGLAPATTRWALMQFFSRYMDQAKHVPITEGSLFAPASAPHGTGISGGWSNTRTPRNGQRWAAALAAALTAAALLTWQKQPSTTTKN